jgi:hypothetical protein
LGLPGTDGSSPFSVQLSHDENSRNLAEIRPAAQCPIQAFRRSGTPRLTSSKVPMPPSGLEIIIVPLSIPPSEPGARGLPAAQCPIQASRRSGTLRLTSSKVPMPPSGLETIIVPLSIPP